MSQLNFEEILEYKKSISKLENTIQQKEIELTSSKKLCEDLKKMNETLRKQNNEENSKIIELRNELENKEKYYDNEISRIKLENERKEQIYKDQISKLSSYNPEGQKNKIQNEIEMKYKQILNQKDNELEEQLNNINDMKKKYELLITEYENFKNEAFRELNTQKEVHKNEINGLLNKIQIQNEKSNFNVDKDIFKEMKNELDLTRNEINQLNLEIEKLRKEKELLILEKNELNMINLNTVDKEKFANQMLSTENEKNKDLLESMKNELKNYQNNLNIKESEIKDLMNEKFSLMKQLNDNEADFQDVRSEVIMLRSLIERRDREILDSLNLSNKEINDGLEREREYMNKYKREIDDLTSQLKNTKINYKNYYEKASIDLHSAQRDYHIVNEENKLLNKRVNDILEELEFIKKDYENKVRAATNYQREYENIENKYREICRNDIELKNSLNAKNKEIENLNDYIKTLQKTGFSNLNNDSNYKNLLKKYNEVSKKKKYYKEQCKIANSNIEKIIEKLKPEQKNNLINQGYNPMLSQSEGSGA